MNIFRLVSRSFIYYRRKNLALGAGVAITTMVITGSLIVGDSVEESLHDISAKRLGNIEMVLDGGDRYLTGELAKRINEKQAADVAPLLLADGMAVAGGGAIRLNQVNVNGVDAQFEQVAGGEGLFSGLSGDSVIISENLSQRLAVSAGDEFLLRMEAARVVPANAPFVSDAGEQISLRVTVKEVIGDDQMGAFNLKTSQTAPYNIFISLDDLQKEMDLDDAVNFLLFSTAQSRTKYDIQNLVEESWTLKDAGFELMQVTGTCELQLSTGRVFIDSIVSAEMDSLPAEPQRILTYFVNSLRSGNQSTPYSFVSSLPGFSPSEGGVIINDWLAEDLASGVGDTLWMNYFVIGPLRELETDSVSLVVEQVIPIGSRSGDRLLMPDIPGLSTAGNCRDWDTGVPVDLDAIRDKDEDYWTRWKGTPKAFIHPDLASSLWSNRFGNATAFRFNPDTLSRIGFESAILDKLSLAKLGIRVVPVRDQAQYAAGNGIDFSELFLGLSFFLLVGGVVLTVMLFLLNIKERADQIRTLSATGVQDNTLLKAYLYEAVLVSMAGAVVGLLLSVVYNQLIFKALNSIWSDIVRTDMMTVSIHPSSMFAGFLASVILTALAVLVPLRKIVRGAKSRHSGRSRKGVVSSLFRKRLLLQMAGLLLFVVAMTIMATGISEGEINHPVRFFTAGGLTMFSGILLFLAVLLNNQAGKRPAEQLWQLGLRNTFRSVSRSAGIVILFAIGTFLVLSTGANRKDLFNNASDRQSGTGGFLYYAESTLPVLKNLEDSEARYEFSLGAGYSFTQFRLAEGDDASCLNLNRISNPAILGVDPAELHGRFRFVTRTPYIDDENPWMTLERDLSGDLVPAVADETVIKWGLGKKVGDTLLYTDARGEELKLLLVGGLAPSVFQGRVIISDNRFLEHFPASSGTNVFLVDGALSDTARISADLMAGMRDLGWEMEFAPARLTEFNSVTNTYLSIFLVMGSIGLLLGTVGLAVLLYSTVLERREELAVLRAIGFRMRQLRRMLVWEYAGLFLAGTLLGFISAVTATFPSLLSNATGISFSTVGWVLLVMLLNGLIWTILMAGMAFRRREIYSSIRNE